jgi:hypothetical protein
MRCAGNYRELMTSRTQVHGEIADELCGRHTVRRENEREHEYVSHRVIVNHATTAAAGSVAVPPHVKGVLESTIR